MTIVHIATKAISRKAGQSAVACAAYRAADVLYDDKYGKTHDYSKKSGVMSNDMAMPSSLRAFGVSVYREMLWNAAEAAESRSDSRVAREWLVNLPYQFSDEDRYQLAMDFAQKLCDDMNVIADVCIHRPVMKLPFDPDAKPSSKRLREGEENPDPRNFHAHILVTTRSPIVGPNKTLAFDPKLKIPFEWSNKKRQAHNLPSSMQEIKRIRQMWVDTANKVLAQYDLPLMDARSYQDQGLDQQPTIKMGVEATAMERRGIITEKGSTNRAINARNKIIAEQTIQQEAEYEQRARNSRHGLAWTTQKNARLLGLIGDAKQRADLAKRLAGSEQHHIAYCNEQSSKAAERADDTKRCIANAESGVTWAAERCQNLPKRIDETEQKIALSERGIAANSRKATDSESIARSINQGITERTRTAPSPFNDDARRARATRLDRQQERIDRDTRENCWSDERIFEAAERMKRHLAIRLLQRSHDDMAIRWAWGETANDYPNKFDRRQVSTLNEFAQTHGMDDNTKELGFTEQLQQVAKRFDHSFVENNISIIQLLRNPKIEREQYLELIKHFESFRDDIDQKREVLNTSLIDKLGGSVGEVGRMTRDIISSFSYMKDLDCYIDNDNHTAEAKEAARAHQAETLDKTCYKLKIAFRDVRTLPTTQSKTYSEALKATLETFTEQYGKVLSESQQKGIQGGLSSYEYQVNRVNTPSRGFSL